MSESHGWIGPRSRQVIDELATETGLSTQEIVGAAIEAYRRQRILEAANVAYARLRANEAEWSVELRERELWDITVGDGIELEESDA